jgi:hypothetical protein
VAALVVVGILAVDERDVEWELQAEGRWTPLCGYCRSELPRLAVVCPDCNRSLDWVKHRAQCTWCLDRTDVEHLRARFDDLDLETEPLPRGLAEFPKAYFLSMDEGTCTSCGGNGSVVEAGAVIACPVCFGDKRCIACGGDRDVVIGDEGAYRRLRERERERRAAERRAEVTDLPVRRTLLVQQDIDRLRGHMELAQHRHTRKLLDLARAKLERAFRALHEETVRMRREAADKPRGS